MDTERSKAVILDPEALALDFHKRRVLSVWAQSLEMKVERTEAQDDAEDTPDS